MPRLKKILPKEPEPETEPETEPEPEPQPSRSILRSPQDLRGEKREYLWCGTYKDDRSSREFR